MRRATSLASSSLDFIHISIHALLAESDKPARFGRHRRRISIHALLAESDGQGDARSPGQEISIHALLAESDNAGYAEQLSLLQFLSTLSLRRATGKPADIGRRECHFYPRSPCGERPTPCGACAAAPPISIHALLAESDRKHTHQAAPPRHFYPRSPCGERPWKMWRNVWELAISIHALLAESDWTAPCSPGGCGYFYPRSPCGERRYASAFPQSMQYFYPRSPCGERRVRQVILAEPFIFISIHALLAESDSRVFMLMPSMRYFYPRSPCGERLTVSTLKILAILFLSTLSLRRATTTSAGRSAFRRHFYPRSPCGERRVGPRWYSGVCNFYPRSPCGERLKAAFFAAAPPIFLSTLSLRRATGPRMCWG